jgi:hypothetical protein
MLETMIGGRNAIMNKEDTVLPIYTLTLGEKAVSQTSFNELNLTN